jgi:hypothetical protein
MTSRRKQEQEAGNAGRAYVTPGPPFIHNISGSDDGLPWEAKNI